MNKGLGILAHVDAGKTTFIEQVSYHTKSIRNRKRVDYRNLTHVYNLLFS